MKREERSRYRDVHKNTFLISRQLFSLAIFFSFLILLFPRVSHASGRAEVKDIRFWSSQGYTRVVVELSRAVEFSRKRLSHPDRLYFDLRNTRITNEVNTKLAVSDGILKQVRAGQYDSSTVRIVLDLDTMDDFNAFILDDPAKLVIDVNAKRAGKMAITKKIIVIDPGHGGHDPGAVGQKGLQEKNVVLDIALKVRELLSQDPDLEIVMTRQKDVFIPLEERTAMALKHDADLFVSIHANASPRRTAKGIETYFLNWTNDEEAIRVAARENQISVKRMKEKLAQYKKDDYVSRILSDLKRDDKREESLKLAHHVQDALFSDVHRVHKKTVNHGVKQALFYVLVGAEMPSILAEVSFISNPEEEQLLAMDSYRAVVATSIAGGIKAYIKSAPPVQKVAFSKKER